jgi:hypothetical protein
VDLEGIRVEEDSLDTMDVHTVPSDVEDNQEVCILDVQGTLVDGILDVVDNRPVVLLQVDQVLDHLAVRVAVEAVGPVLVVLVVVQAAKL